MRRLRSARASGAVFALAAVAAAAPATSEYHGAAGCPGEFTFRAQVQARTDRYEVTPAAAGAARDAAPSATRFVVWLWQQGNGYRGRLEVSRRGVTTKSELSATTCDEVVAGLSIAAALTAESEVAAPSASAPPPRDAEARAVPAPQAEPVTEQGAASLRSGSRWLLGAALGERFGYSPRAGLAAGLMLGRSPAPGEAGIGFRVAANVTFADDISNAGPPPLRLGFTWLGVAADLCPLQLRTGPTSALLPCGSLEVGVLRAAATTGEISVRPWVAPGLVLRFSAAWGGFFVEPLLAARLPLFRDRYWFQPDTQAFQVPILTLEAALVAGLRFE